MASPGRTDRIEVVDYLRLIAAAMVLAYHWFYNGIANGKIDSIAHSPLAEIAKYGYLGVDLFFLISGYVIAKSAVGKTPRRFAVGRVVRLYPVFWVAMAVTVVFAVFLGGDLMGVTPLQVLANLTMAPSIFGQPFVDGVYWTLFYELAFYAVVFLILLARCDRWLDGIMCVWAIGMAVVAIVVPGPGSVPFMGGYFALFASGAIISAMQRAGWTALRAGGLAAGFGTVLAFEVRDAHGMNALILGALTVTIFAALLVTLNPRVANLRLPGSQAAGQLTYPLYLVHAHIGYMLIDTFAREHNTWWVYASVLAFVVMLAWGLHVTVERGRFWYGLVDRSVGVLVGGIDDAIYRRKGPDAIDRVS